MDRHIWHCWPDEASPTYELTLLSEIIRGQSPVVTPGCFPVVPNYVGVTDVGCVQTARAACVFSGFC